MYLYLLGMHGECARLCPQSAELDAPGDSPTA